MASVTTQDLAKGDLQTDQEQVFFTPYRLQGGQDTVAGQMEGLLASKSPYIKAAESSAQQGMNERGLLNSSMAISAGHKAAIESAMPIAQQDAGYFQNQGIQAQQGDIQTGHIDQQGRIQSGHIDQQGRIQTGHIDQQGRIQSGHIKQQGVIQRDLANISGGYQLSAAHISGGYQLKATQLQGTIAMDIEDKRSTNQAALNREDRAWRAGQTEDEREWQDTRTGTEHERDDDRRAEDTKQQGITVGTAAKVDYENSIQRIVADPTLSATQKQDLIGLANSNMEGVVSGIEATYKIALNWVAFEFRAPDSTPPPPRPPHPTNDYDAGLDSYGWQP